jgi:hypothetical protein
MCLADIQGTVKSGASPFLGESPQLHSVNFSSVLAVRRSLLAQLSLFMTMHGLSFLIIQQMSAPLDLSLR